MPNAAEDTVATLLKPLAPLALLVALAALALAWPAAARRAAVRESAHADSLSRGP